MKVDERNIINWGKGFKRITLLISIVAFIFGISEGYDKFHYEAYRDIFSAKVDLMLYEGIVKNYENNNSKEDIFPEAQNIFGDILKENQKKLDEEYENAKKQIPILKQKIEAGIPLIDNIIILIESFSAGLFMLAIVWVVYFILKWLLLGFTGK